MERSRSPDEKLAEAAMNAKDGAWVKTRIPTPAETEAFLADKLTALQPDLKVLYISGYDNTQVVQKYVVEKGHALLTKPFSLDTLRAKVAEILARSVKTKAGV